MPPADRSGGVNSAWRTRAGHLYPLLGDTGIHRYFRRRRPGHSSVDRPKSALIAASTQARANPPGEPPMAKAGLV
jgi:hypothetical protein